jgi:ribosomal protein S15P/S13E
MVEQLSLTKSNNNLATHLAQAIKNSPTAQILQLLSERREAILSLATEHEASNVRIFGSLARQQAHPNSDVDFLMGP